MSDTFRGPNHKLRKIQKQRKQKVAIVKVTEEMKEITREDLPISIKEQVVKQLQHELDLLNYGIS